MRIWIATIAAMVAGAAGCATPAEQARPGSRGMRASDHLEAAREHTEAAEKARWPDTRPAPQQGPGAVGGGPPWFYYWDADEHARLAQEHRSEAAAIEAEYAQACGTTPAADVSVSPLQRWAIGGQPAPRGAIVYLSSDAGPPERVLAAMRCHRAWMMLGRNGMDDCPLDLAGIEVVAHATADSIEVLITTRDPSLVAELQRRTAKDVEAAATRLHATPPGRTP
jgi:hypothetical protein